MLKGLLSVVRDISQNSDQTVKNWAVLIHFKPIFCYYIAHFSTKKCWKHNSVYFWCNTVCYQQAPSRFPVWKWTLDLQTCRLSPVRVADVLRGWGASLQRWNTSKQSSVSDHYLCCGATDSRQGDCFIVQKQHSTPMCQQRRRGRRLASKHKSKKIKLPKIAFVNVFWGKKCTQSTQCKHKSCLFTRQLHRAPFK